MQFRVASRTRALAWWPFGDKNSGLLGWDRGEQMPIAPALLIVALLALAKGLVYLAVAQHFRGTPASLCHFDCGWYLSVAKGYQVAPLGKIAPGQANWAFFPLFPLLIRSLLWTTASPVLAGLAAAALCSVGFSAAFVCYAHLRRPDVSPWFWIFLVTAWPFGFYWQIPYTEGLYALLAMLALTALARERLPSAAVATALLSATRPTGILLSLCVAWRSLWRGVRSRQARPRPPLLRDAADTLLPIAVAPLGLAAFAAFLWWKMGDPLAFSHVQIAWHRTFVDPLRVLVASLTPQPLAALHYWRTAPPQLPYGLAALAGLAAGVFLMWRRRFDEGIFLAGTVLIALSTGIIMSMQRFVGANPVFVLAMGEAIVLIRRKCILVPLLCGMALLQLLFLLAWINGAFFLA